MQARVSQGEATLSINFAGPPGDLHVPTASPGTASSADAGAF